MHLLYVGFSLTCMLEKSEHLDDVFRHLIVVVMLLYLVKSIVNRNLPYVGLKVASCLEASSTEGDSSNEVQFVSKRVASNNSERNQGKNEMK
jgi:hypothetical protein